MSRFAGHCAIVERIYCDIEPRIKEWVSRAPQHAFATENLAAYPKRTCSAYRCKIMPFLLLSWLVGQTRKTNFVRFSGTVLSARRGENKLHNMERNQQQEQQNAMQPTTPGAGKHPGQQLPSGEQQADLEQPAMTEKEVRHSDSSFPQNDGETLGTP